MTDRAPLAKATFLAAVACPTQGWRMYRAAPGEVTAAMTWGWHQGDQVQRTARVQLGDGVFLPQRGAAAAEATARAMAEAEADLFFEATVTSHGCVARADAIRRIADGWEVVEVKSATFKDDDGADPAHLDDLAYTVMVALGAGVSVTRCTLMLVDRAYRLDGTVPLLRTLDVTDEVLTRAAAFAEIRSAIVTACQGETIPEASLRFVCRDCDFFASMCLGAGITDPIFQVPRLLRQHFEKTGPVLRLADLPATPPLTATQLRFLEVHRGGVPLTDPAVLAALDTLTWPVAYLDFEAVQPAIPWFSGDGPYELIPFQYSLHRRHTPDGEAEHREFLADPGTDWRHVLIDRLLHDLGETGSIVVYSAFEKTILTRLMTYAPDRADALARLITRLVDLEPIIRKGYQHPGFRGRTSIKVVLPVMAPDLSYDTLDVGDGLEAAARFALMQVGKIPETAHAECRAHLLAYCGLDTVAMVRVHQGLEGVRANG